MKTILKILPLIFLLLGCETSRPDPTAVEHIQIPYPIPGERWLLSEAIERNKTTRRWSKPGNNLTLTIVHRPPLGSPSDFRLGMDRFPRSEHGDRFSSKILSESEISGYPSLILKTKLEQTDGTIRFTLLLKIHGNEAGYLLYRQWANEAEYLDEWMQWKEFFERVSIFDPRKVG